MKVRELIEVLRREDPEAVVVTGGPDDPSDVTEPHIMRFHVEIDRRGYVSREVADGGVPAICL